MHDKVRVFVDMDGTLCGWRSGADMDELLRPGFFTEMKCQENIAAAVRLMLDNLSDVVSVHILSAVLSESKTAEREKNEWLDTFNIAVPPEHRIFCPCGEPKAAYIEDGIRPTDILLDDYSRNLHEWAACNAHGIKVYNGINGTHGTWDGEYISSSMSPDAIVLYICQSIVRRNMLLPSMAGAYTC